MIAEQKRTYLVYSRGLLPEDLKLGSLYLDPANPLDGERKRFESSLDESELAKWTGTPDVTAPLTLSFSASRHWTIASGLFNLLEGEIGRGKSHEVIISGSSGVRRQIKKPETFLNEVVLKSEGARAWLAAHLSVSRYAAYKRNTLGTGTRIWLVTGIQTVANANISVVNRQDKSLSFSATAPAPDPVVAAVTVLTGDGGIASVGVTNTTTKETATSYGHEDARIWAAQFTQLSVKFTSKSSGLQSQVGPSAWIQLRDLPDHQTGGIRASARPNGVPSLNNEVAEILVGGDDGEEQLEGEDLLDLMQDVDWEELDEFIEV
ncbi:hypothetical protein TWF696_000440 [Orbilia brochopaga]|uniref:Uncharacterized protein n=1 Tax=Orbilia brochopaga TaxID=3140254 RepID=A0AAV9VBA8_9PEZI